MKKRISMIYTAKGDATHRNKALFMVSLAFLLGGILGFLVYSKLPSSQYITLFLTEDTVNPTISKELWGVFRWPLGLLILRIFPLAGLTIPAFMTLRGFLLSYNISAFTEGSMKVAVLLFGPTCVFTLPVVFLLSTEILLRKAGGQSERKAAVILACFLALCLCVVIDLTVVPQLLT